MMARGQRFSKGQATPENAASKKLPKAASNGLPEQPSIDPAKPLPEKVVIPPSNRAEDSLGSRLDVVEIFTQMANSVQEIFWMLDVRTNEIIYISPAFETICGRTVQSLCEDPLSYHELIHPDDRERLLERLHELPEASRLDQEFRIVRPDGEVRWLWVRGFAVRNTEGQTTRLVGSARDVSPRKKAEEALRRSEEQYRALFEGAPYGIFRATLDGKLLVANLALVKMLGYQSEKTLLNGASAAAFFRDVARLNFHAGHGQAQETSLLSDIAWRRKDGSQIVLSVRCWILPAGSEAPRLIEGTIEDVTQRRILEEQLLQSQKMEAIALMAGGVAHDFNALLIAILGYSERMILARDLSEHHRRAAEEVIQAALQGRTLTQQLLAFGRRQVLQPKLLDLNRLLLDSKNLLGSLTGKETELLLSLDSYLLRVKADPGQITQVILNLAINARDAMTQGGRLTIITNNVELKPEYAQFARFTPGNYVLLEVRDTGCGIDEATQARIFEPFFSTKPQGKGTGLGLSTVHGIIQQSGGQITVSSKLGEGTSFKIFLPASDEYTEEQSANERGKELFSGIETILVVEDSDLTRRLTCENLRENGYEVLPARNAREAREIGRNYRKSIHLLLTDVVMPGMSGERLAESFASLHPETKVLYMTGYAEAMSVSASENPVPHVLQKPFLAHELMGKVREVLSDGGKNRTNFVH